MNILHVIASMNPSGGGPAQGLRNIVPVLIKAGINSQVVSMDDPQSDFLKGDSIPVHAMGRGSGKWQYQHELLNWLDKNIHDLDAVIIHGLWLYHGFAVYKALRKAVRNKTSMPKLYIMPHGMLDPWFQKAPGRKLKAFRNWVYWKFIEAKIVNAADGIFFTCAEELVSARKTFRPYLPKREINIGYGIENPPIFKISHTAAFSKKCPGTDNSTYILFLGRIDTKKGIDLLISSYLLLENKKNKFPKLVIAGPGMETAFGKKMKSLATSTNNILFPGMLTGDAKWGAFYGSEAFILPSHQENFGIAIAEAMACGKPVLVSDKVNIWREVKKGGGGIVANDTLNGTLQLLEAWQSMDQTNREKMGIAAKKTFEDHFRVEKTTERFIKAITVSRDLNIKIA